MDIGVLVKLKELLCGRDGFWWEKALVVVFVSFLGFDEKEGGTRWRADVPRVARGNTVCEGEGHGACYNGVWTSLEPCV